MQKLLRIKNKICLRKWLLDGRKANKPRKALTKHSRRGNLKGRKIRYLTYLFLLALSFSFSSPFFTQPSYALHPTDAKGKNIVKEDKVCPKGKYLNPETKRCKKFPEQKIKTCPKGHFLNPKTNRCNKNPAKKPQQGNNQNKPASEQTPPRTCPTGSIYNATTKRCNKIKTNQQSKTCRPGYFLNQITKRCNKDTNRVPKTCPAGSFLNKLTGRCNKNLTESEKKPCRTDQVRNPQTGRCHKLAASATPKTCPEGKILNPATNRCKSPEKTQEIKPCREGYERHPDTNRCRKIHQNTGAENPVEVPKLGDSKDKKDEKKNFTGTTAVAGSAAVGLGIAIFQFKNEIFVIIRKIFLHK